MDQYLTEIKENQDKLEIVNKESIEAELQVSALRRRLALAEEEKRRADDKQENLYIIFAFLFF